METTDNPLRENEDQGPGQRDMWVCRICGREYTNYHQASKCQESHGRNEGLLIVVLVLIFIAAFVLFFVGNFAPWGS